MLLVSTAFSAADDKNLSVKIPLLAITVTAVADEVSSVLEPEIIEFCPFTFDPFAFLKYS